MSKIRSDKGVKRKPYKQNLPVNYRSYQLSSNAQGKTFSLTLEEFNHLLTLDCVYCGLRAAVVGLLDTGEGYTLENVSPCCEACNDMKGSMNEREFIKKIEKVYIHLKIK